jgi:hypothetical protein
MIAIERRMEAAALDLSRRTTHAVAADRRRALLAGSTLGAEQRLAFGHVTRSRDLAVVVGYAGSGKSTMLGAARQAWEAQGYTVRGAALSGIAAEGLEAGSGIVSRTIASWEHAWARGRELLGPRDVLVMDEAGMVGSRQMDRVLAAVRESGAKLVLVGDHEQLQAIEAGAAFRAIAERVGAAEITEVRRQQTEWQRAATRELATGRTGDALDRYAGAGMLHAHGTDDAARAALIAGWQDARQQAPGDSQIILAHTRDDVRRLNDQARELRRDAGELGADQVLPTELGARAFAAGDRIYFLRNERGLGVKNGTLGTITEIAGLGKGARLTVRLDRVEQATGAAAVVSFGLAEYAHIDHGYAATVHKAQSVTFDRAHVLATPGMDRHLAYVALTRHRHSLALHWSEESVGSREGLIARLGRERAKDTTLDYGESDAELCAAYAERRWLQPVPPASEIVAGAAGRTAGNDASVVAEFRALAAAQPEVVRQNVQRAHLDRTLRPMIGPLQRATEQQEDATLHIAAWVKELSEEQARAVAVTEPAKQAPEPDPQEVARLTALIDSYPPHGPNSMGERLAWFGARMALERLQGRQESPPTPLPLPRIEPLLPGIRPLPVQEREVAIMVSNQLFDGRQRQELERLIETAYRDPPQASERLRALVRESGEYEAARSLKQAGAAALGALRGGSGLLASGRAKAERRDAEAAAGKMGSVLVGLSRERASLIDKCRAELEARRDRQSIEVPGLSREASTTIRSLRNAGADGRPRHGTGQMADVAAVWATIKTNQPVCDELARFEVAAKARLGTDTNDYEPLAARQVRDLLDVLVDARGLHDRHVEQTERREAARIADAKRQAEAEAKIREWQRYHPRGSRPRPSSGPGMG